MIKVNGHYFAVMEKGLDPIPPGRFRYMDGKDIKGKLNLSICQLPLP